MTGTYRLADRVIGIVSEYPRVHTLCRDYRADAEPDFIVRSDPQMIAAEREYAARSAETEGRPARRWSDAYLETLAIYRVIAEKLPDYDALLFHGSALALDGRAYLFTAKSGTGKSTHARLWRERFGERVVMINDDKPLLRVTEDGAVAYGTPWGGKHHLSCNTSAPLKAICILERAAENRISRIGAADALGVLLQQCYRPADPAAAVKTYVLLDRLLRTAGLYRLGCNMEPDAVTTAYEGMQQG